MHTLEKKQQNGPTTYVSPGKFRQAGIPELPGNLQDKRRNPDLIPFIASHLFFAVF